VRLLLLTQDRLVQKEARLREIDEAEESTLFLARSRLDANVERLALVEELKTLLANYGLLARESCDSGN
jgi:hypothetical protein